MGGVVNLIKRKQVVPPVLFLCFFVFVFVCDSVPVQ